MTSEKTITPLNMLTKDMLRRTIKGRITKLWTAQHPKKKTVFSYDFILVDQQNTAIEGYISIKEPNANEILQKLEEGRVHEIYKFKPDIERPTFKTVDHKVRIELTTATEITKMKDDDGSFPIRYFNFNPFSDIGTTKTNKSVVDIVGQITSVRLKKIGTTSVVDMEIENERNDKITVSIWEDCLPQINFDIIEQQSKTQHVVLAFSSLQVQLFVGNWTLKSYSATRIYQDKSITEIRDFLRRITHKRIQAITNPVPPLQQQPNETPPAYVSIKDLDHLCKPNENKLFHVMAEITEVLDEFGWYYLSCPTHRNRVTPTTTSFNCPKCDTELEQPLPWLNFCIRVKDYTGEANFVFIGKMAEKLIGNSAQELLAQQTDKMELPPQFNEIKNKEKLFIVTSGKFKSASPNYQVLEIEEITATSETSMEIEQSGIQPGTPPDEHCINSSGQELKITTTTEKRKAKQLLLEQPSKKPRISSGTNKGKGKKEPE